MPSGPNQILMQKNKYVKIYLQTNVVSRIRRIKERLQFALILPELPWYHALLRNKSKPSHQGLKRACDKLQKIIASVLWLLISPGSHTSRVLKKIGKLQRSKFPGLQRGPFNQLALSGSSPTSASIVSHKAVVSQLRF